MTLRNWQWLVLGSATCILSACGPEIEQIDYSKQVKPILNKHCISCHGGVNQNGGFGLLTREQALADTESEQPAIVPGDGHGSEMIKRLLTSDLELRMPLDEDPLSPEDIGILSRWIDEGVAWNLHWAYRPIKEVSLPAPDALLGAVGETTSTQVQPIDLFIRKKLHQVGIQLPSPTADKATLLRRLSLDLTGLPPPDHLAQSYLLDDRPSAYGALVDSLLAVPQFGEKWTSMWLDIARYADSKGYERDPHRDIWHYRDWVIKAFNDDMPYDQFLIEQFAGDLLPNPTDDQLIATAFHRNTSTNDEGGSDNEEYRTYAIFDRVNTTWEGVLGTTFACVQCHSHPYDPFIHEDYYKFFAFFNNTRDADTAPDYPLLRHFTSADSVRLDRFLAWAGKRLDENRLTELKTFIKTWQPAYHSIETDSFERSDLYDTKYLGFRQNGSCRLSDVNLTGKDMIYFRYRTKLADGLWQWQDIKTGTLIASTTLASTNDKWVIARIPLTGTFDGVHDLMLSYRNPNLKDPDARGVSFDWFRFCEDYDLWEGGQHAEQEDIFWDLLNTKTETTPIMIENPVDMQRTTRVFDRGNWLVEKEEVTPAVPSILPPIPDDVPADRLALATWLTDKENPLTARTMVNRIWSQIFGRGLVETLEDLGSQTPLPSHPEMFDWLAYEFMHAHDWHLKSFLKEIVMSETYQQQSNADAERLEKDPYNIFLSRGARVRLSAEQMRDQALAVSGLLNKEMYGPSIMPFQPIQWDVPYSREQWKVSEDGHQHRRSVYIYWKRTIPYPAMVIFDAAARDVCEARRIQTNTPLHALVALNDPVYVEAASHLARRMWDQGSDLDGRLEAGYQMTMGVPISDDQKSVFTDLFEEAQSSFAAGDSNAKELLAYLPGEEERELAAMVVIANAMLNMDEFITKN